MSLEQSTELAAGARRRIVALPARVEAPVALIMRETDLREALTDHLGRRRVVSFPSLAHFCTEEQRRQPWLGIVMGYSCAWDAQLDRYVPHTSCIGLYQVPEEGHGWPEGVARISERDQLDAWLSDLAEPMPAWKRAIEEARKKPRKARRSVEPRSAGESQLSLPMGGDPPDESRARALPTRTARPAKSRATTDKRAVKKAAPERAASARAKPLKEAPAPSVARGRAHPRGSIALNAKELAAVSRAGAHLPRELVRLASEIGLSRAQQLLRGLRQNARTITTRSAR